MGKVSALVAPILLEQAMCLPEKNKIIGAGWDYEKQAIVIIVEGDDLPEPAEGEKIVAANPTVTVETNKKGRVLSKKFSWNLPGKGQK